MATSIFFGGRRINIPGAYSVIDASSLAGVSPGAVGIVALIGTAEGGKPLSVDSEFSDATRPEKIIQRYRSGDLRIAGQFAFDPSNDDAIPGGAQRVVAVKVNPATQSEATLADDNAVDAAELLSVDYGQFTEQISIEVAAGTAQGKKYTIVFEGTTEEFDNVGGSAIFDALYTPGAEGFDTAIGTLNATNFTVASTKAELGLDTERAADIPAPGVVDVVSSAVGDTTQSITIYGLNALNVPIKEVIALNGTTNVQGALAFTSITGVRLSAAAVGTITVSDFPVTTTLFSLAPAVLTRGLVLTTNTPAAGVATVSIDVDTAVDVVVRGLNANGVEVAERFDMTTGNTTPVVGVVAFASIIQIELGDVPAARTITLSINAVNTSHSVFTTVQRLVDKLNTLDGFTANALASNATTFLMVDADYNVAPARPAPSLLVAASFYADLFALIEAVSEGSAFIDVSRSTGGSLPPANTVGPVFLQGGSEGVPTITEWQTAFNLLKKRRVNIIVPLTSDAAVHALLASHLVQRAGKLRSEANGYVGLGDVDDEADTKSNIKSRIQSLGTRHISATGQEPKRFHPDTGEAVFWPPYMFAAIAAGMQAGSPIGEPLTHKRPAVTAIRQHSSWTVEDDAEEMIDAGLMMAENVDGLGIRWIRSITTHLADDNVVFTEMSANESANTAVFEFRRAMEQRIGQRGLSGSLASIKGLAQDVLERLIDDEIIVAFKSLTVEQIADVFPISVEIAPVLPVNFIPITVHLVAIRAAA